MLKMAADDNNECQTLRTRTRIVETCHQKNKPLKKSSKGLKNASGLDKRNKAQYS